MCEAIEAANQLRKNVDIVLSLLVLINTNSSNNRTNKKEKSA